MRTASVNVTVQMIANGMLTGASKILGHVPGEQQKPRQLDRLGNKDLLFVGGTIDEPCIQAVVYWRFWRLSISYGFCCSHGFRQVSRQNTQNPQ
jgi:hypothetical protein